MEPTQARIKRLLVVEDDPTTVQMVVALLRNEPYRLIFASSALDAMRLARMYRPDAMLLSWTLPEMTGDQLADLLLLHPDTASLPLILFGLEPWIFSERHRRKAVQVVNNSFVDEELLPRVREALHMPPAPSTSLEVLTRIRDRSLWWEGEEEVDWRAILRQQSRLLSARS